MPLKPSLQPNTFHDGLSKNLIDKCELHIISVLVLRNVDGYPSDFKHIAGDFYYKHKFFAQAAERFEEKV